jgi:DNA polymerase III epsilon subunit-like protein
MVDFATLFAPGLRALETDGRMAQAAESAPELTGSSLYVVDLEMSGPNASMHEVIDIGGVRASLSDGLPEESSWGSRVKPKHIGNAVPGALKVTGYSPKAWKGAVDLEPAMARFEEVGAGAVITGWGISQDMAFLAESFRRVGRPWPFAAIAFDVQFVARKLLKGTGDVDHFNLGHVADRLGIGRLGEHGALADAYATYDVLLKLVERAAADVQP